MKQKKIDSWLDYSSEYPEEIIEEKPKLSMENAAVTKVYTDKNFCRICGKDTERVEYYLCLKCWKDTHLSKKYPTKRERDFWTNDSR